jgi:addiction module HigA family antidote
VNRILPKHGPPSHPGEILLEEYLKPLGMRQTALATKMGVSIQRINQIINGKRGVTAQTAVLLGKVLDTDPWFWMELQAQYDLWFALRDAEGVAEVSNDLSTTVFNSLTAPAAADLGPATRNLFHHITSDPSALQDLTSSKIADAYGRMDVYVNESPSILNVPLAANEPHRWSSGGANA